MERLNFLMEQLEGQYGPEELERIRSGYACRRRTSLRVNPLRADPRQAEEMLTQADIRFERVSWYSDAFLLDAGMEERVQALPVYESGGIYLPCGTTTRWKTI